MSSFVPPLAFQFRVKFYLDGILRNPSEADFQSVSGISRTIGATAHREGGVNDRVYNLPTPPTYGDVSCKRGVYMDSKLHEWFREAVEEFKFTTAPVVIELIGKPKPAGGGLIKGLHPLIKWTLEDAYPASWTPSGLDAENSAILTETVVLKCQKITRRVIKY